MTKNTEKTLKVVGIVALVGVGGYFLIKGINGFTKNKVSAFIDTGEDKSPAGSNFLRNM